MGELFQWKNYFLSLPFLRGSTNIAMENHHLMVFTRKDGDFVSSREGIKVISMVKTPSLAL